MLETIKNYEPPEGLKEELKHHIKVLKSYYLENGPIPSNSLAILNFLEKILDYEGTNSFYFASEGAKLIALAYVLILISHTADYPQFTGGMLINDPISIAWLEQEGPIKELIEFVKKGLELLNEE